jgi:predicted transporter
MPQISAFIEQVAGYIPNVIAAAVIIFIGIVAANALGNAAGKASKATRIVPSNIIIAAVRYPILLFAALAALSQLQIATDMIRILFGGIVFALSLALGLAFGLGGRDEAQRILEGMSVRAKTVSRK